jgi:NTE family protein
MTNGAAITDCTVVLVLSGGNALGAYHAGGYQALHERGVLPHWVVGASTGAANGAIICGNPEDQRVSRLAEHWGLGAAPDGPAPQPWWATVGEDLRRSTASIAAMTFGHPHVFAPRLQPPSLWDAFGHVGQSSLYDTQPLGRTLSRLVDFDRLNSGFPRYTLTAVDLESGEQVVYDTRRQVVGVDHVRGSSALLPAFSPVEVDGRLLGDGGLAANLPLDVVLSDPPSGPVLCIALDLLPLAARRPRTLGEAASRMQDLIFAAQSARTIAAWQALYDARATPAAVTLAYLAYDRQEAEVAGKAFDFSLTSARARWDAGYRDVGDALDRLGDGNIQFDRPGLTVWRPTKATS